MGLSPRCAKNKGPGVSDDLEHDVKTRSASIKETGEELSAAEWARFDAAVAADRAERRKGDARVAAGPQTRNAPSRGKVAEPR